MTVIAAAKKKRDFDPQTFLATIGEGRKIVPFHTKQTILAQGDGCDAVFYIQKGKVRRRLSPRLGRKQR
jgi:CRP/FNR family transcriptional regulator, cyclic AMP receptor protein